MNASHTRRWIIIGLAALVMIAALLVPALTLPDRVHPSHQDVRKPISTPIPEDRDSLRWGILGGGVLIAGVLLIVGVRYGARQPN